jgi:hypothetical protein
MVARVHTSARITGHDYHECHEPVTALTDERLSKQIGLSCSANLQFMNLFLCDTEEKTRKPYLFSFSNK